MFEQPTKADIDRALSTLMHEARHRLTARRNEIKAEAAKAGARQSNRLIVTIAAEADKIHIEAIQQATAMLREFIQRMSTPPATITEWARPHLENLGNALLGLVPATDFPNDHKRVVAQYQAQFSQRVRARSATWKLGTQRGLGSWERSKKMNGCGRPMRWPCSNRS